MIADSPHISLRIYHKYENKRIRNTSFGGDSLKDVKNFETNAEIRPNPTPDNTLSTEIYRKAQTVFSY